MKSVLLVFCLLSVNSMFAQDVPPPPPIIMESKPLKKMRFKTIGIVEFPDVEAEFIGGSKGLQQYISKNITYPQEALNNQIGGRVYLSFVVKKNGKVKNVVIRRGVHSLLDREAKRVIEEMPRWNPAKLNGRRVNTRCSLPINFMYR